MRLQRDLKPVQEFTTYLEEHRRNACCEIPPVIVRQAILNARQIPFDSETPYCNKAEEHPANLMLVQWWNANAPNQKNRCAGHAKVWVRVEDNHEYWSGWHEEPDRSVILGITNPEAVARCGNFLLLEFAKSRSTMYEDRNEIVCEDVSGEIFESVMGIGLKDYDPAWYGLAGFYHFPHRFPVAWQSLCDATSA